MPSTLSSGDSMGIPRAARVPTAEPLRWPSSDARAWAEGAFSELCASPNVLALVLFGSSVRPVESSFDLDCLFVYQGDRPVLPAAPMEVDVRAYPADQVDRLIEEGHDLLGWCIRFGRVVCEREEYWTRLTERWQASLPFPSAEVADQRAEAAERLAAELEEIGDEDAAVEQTVSAATHRARAALIRAAVFPASRPELPAQLRQIGARRLASNLEKVLALRSALAREYLGISAEPARGAA